jgi:hypothetical protein
LIAALAGSVVLWIAAAYAYTRAVRRVVAALPREWREHPELSRHNTAPARAEYGSALVRLAPFWVAAAAGFVALSALDVLPVVQIAAAVAGGAWWAATIRAESRAFARHIAERDGLPQPERVPGRSAFTVTLYMLCLAIALSACFAGQAIWSLAG